MSALCHHLLKLSLPLPSTAPIGVGKVVGMLAASQGNLPLFKEISLNLQAVLTMLNSKSKSNNFDLNLNEVPAKTKIKKNYQDFEELVEPLLAITGYIGGLSVHRPILKQRSTMILELLNNVFQLEQPQIGSNPDSPDNSERVGGVRETEDEVSKDPKSRVPDR